MDGIFWLLGGVVAYFAYQQYELAQKIGINFKSISVGGNVTSPVVQVVLTVSNPSNSGAILQDINANVFLNGSLIGIINQSFSDEIIAGNSNTDIVVPVNISDLGILTQIINLLSGSGYGQTSFTVTGKIGADFISIPVNVQYQL